MAKRKYPNILQEMASENIQEEENSMCAEGSKTVDLSFNVCSNPRTSSSTATTAATSLPLPTIQHVSKGFEGFNPTESTADELKKKLKNQSEEIREENKTLSTLVEKMKECTLSLEELAAAQAQIDDLEIKFQRKIDANKQLENEINSLLELRQESKKN
ncbi:uncharacterized protein LOC142326826 [Lycorma delicatula]|uniref:uncharacterized protein LOC142326826 n=1 Tax=Lycorma delicatula TaxID=130591 RepID=UPI003F519667